MSDPTHWEDPDVALLRARIEELERELRHTERERDVEELRAKMQVGFSPDIIMRAVRKKALEDFRAIVDEVRTGAVSAAEAVAQVGRILDHLEEIGEMHPEG